MNKDFIKPGDIVILKHNELTNKPYMLALNIIVSDTINKIGYDQEVKKGTLIGINCGWYNNSQTWCEKIYSTKDLIKHLK